MRITRHAFLHRRVRRRRGLLLLTQRTHIHRCTAPSRPSTLAGDASWCMPARSGRLEGGLLCRSACQHTPCALMGNHAPQTAPRTDECAMGDVGRCVACNAARQEAWTPPQRGCRLSAAWPNRLRPYACASSTGCVSMTCAREGATNLPGTAQGRLSSDTMRRVDFRFASPARPAAPAAVSLTLRLTSQFAMANKKQRRGNGTRGSGGGRRGGHGFRTTAQPRLEEYFEYYDAPVRLPSSCHCLSGLITTTSQQEEVGRRRQRRLPDPLTQRTHIYRRTAPSRSLAMQAGACRLRAVEVAPVASRSLPAHSLRSDAQSRTANRATHT